MESHFESTLEEWDKLRCVRTVGFEHLSVDDNVGLGPDNGMDLKPPFFSLLPMLLFPPTTEGGSRDARGVGRDRPAFLQPSKGKGAQVEEMIEDWRDRRTGEEVRGDCIAGSLSKQSLVSHVLIAPASSPTGEAGIDLQDCAMDFLTKRRSGWPMRAWGEGKIWDARDKLPKEGVEKEHLLGLLRSVGWVLGILLPNPLPPRWRIGIAPLPSSGVPSR